MDQELKQRLVGAVVLTSLAVIFVPMLFDDPIDQSGKRIGELEIPPQPVSYHSPLARLAKTVEDVIALPKPLPIKQLEAEQVASNLERWYIQLGTFGNKNNAIALQKKMSDQGFPVTVKEVTTDKGIMYRVRVGPELDKKRAEKTKLKIDKQNGLKSILSSDDG
jgi:DedD protein